MKMVTGKEVTPYLPATEPSVSVTAGYVMPYCCKKLVPLLPGSWKSIPRKITSLPCDCACFHVLSRSGASSLHGSHHEAQKFKTTGLPLKFESAITLVEEWVLSIVSEKFGAGWSIRGSDLETGAGVSNWVKINASSPKFTRLTAQNIKILRLRLF